jgi:uncharacterized protein YdeI (YjbR/CyaY-like superfamily)
MIELIDDYFAKGCGRCARFATPDCSALLWAEGLRALRDILREADVQETVKWGHPCYSHAGRNVAIIGAFRTDFRLTFFSPALMKDPHGVLQRSGPNTRHADMIRFAGAAEVVAQAALIRAYLAEAVGYAAAGIYPEKPAPDLDLPPVLVSALSADRIFAEAFHRLTAGRQRSYVIALSSARTEATQVVRVARFREKVLAGKGANER